MKQPTLDSATHIASAPVVIHGRCIQRCGWCGEKLLDTYEKGIVFPTGSLVKSHEDLFLLYKTRWEHLPADNCVLMVE